MKEYQCTPAEDGHTALEILQYRLPHAPRSYLRQLLRRGKVRRPGGLALTEESRLASGDRLLLPESRRLQELRAVPAVPKPTVLLETRDLLAVYKPAGLAVHRAVGHSENLTDLVQAMMEERREPFRIAPAHRLDAATSGPVLFGKGRRAIAALGAAFQERAVEKVYLALVSGRPAATAILDSPVPAKGKWKEAAAEFRLLESPGEFSFLEVRLHSGRTHQIRRQLADIGHPIVGDRRHGGSVVPGLDRLFLHCARLALRTCLDRSRLVIECPLPTELAALLARLATSGVRS